MKLPGKWGLILLAAWLIAMGLVPLFNVAEPLLSKALHVLAVAAGVLILIDR